MSGHGHSHNGAPCSGHDAPEGEGSSGITPDMRDIIQRLSNAGLNLSQLPNLPSAPRNLEEAKTKNFEFWSTQPVPAMTDDVPESVNEAIEPNIPQDKVRSEPFSLPDGFEWSDVDVNNDEQLHELYVLLAENYVEDDESTFRFAYSEQFLKWALLIPGWRQDWHCGVRAKKTGRLLAFISAVPQAIRVFDKAVKMVEINFLCAHKKLRAKRVAPVLIREITRRVHKQGIFQAAFTAGIVIPKPVSVCRYYHRTLNPKKLVEIKFSHMSENMTMSRMIRIYKLPDNTATTGLRPMKASDAPEVLQLLIEGVKKYSLAPIFSSAEEVTHLLVPREDIIYTYVVEGKDGKLTDVLSFYSIPSTVIGHPSHKVLRAAYLYYYAVNTVPFKQIVNDALILAHKAGFDVFNALDLMGNNSVFTDLKFGIGDGNLQYYLYNWKCANMTPNQIGLVLL